MELRQIIISAASPTTAKIHDSEALLAISVLSALHRVSQLISVEGDLRRLFATRAMISSYDQSGKARVDKQVLSMEVNVFVVTVTVSGCGIYTYRLIVLTLAPPTFHHHVYIFFIMMFEQSTQPLPLRPVINHPWSGASTHSTVDGKVE